MSNSAPMHLRQWPASPAADGTGLAQSFSGKVELTEDGVSVGEFHVTLFSDSVTQQWDGWLQASSAEVYRRFLARDRWPLRFPNGSTADIRPLQRASRVGAAVLFEGLGAPPPLW